MAVYTNATAINTLLGTALVTDLQDFDQDGSADSNVLDNAITDVTSEIDSRLGTKYVVPFADISDSTPTPLVIQKIARYLVAEQLLLARTELSVQREAYGEQARELLSDILTDALIVPNATRLDSASADAHSGFHYDSSDAADPLYSGLDDNDDDPMARF